MEKCVLGSDLVYGKAKPNIYWRTVGNTKTRDWNSITVLLANYEKKTISRI